MKWKLDIPVLVGIRRRRRALGHPRAMASNIVSLLSLNLLLAPHYTYDQSVDTIHVHYNETLEFVFGLHC